MSKVPTPKRGEIWLVDFDPSVGAEIRKLRPAAVIGLDGLGRLPLRIVVPLTDWKAAFDRLSWFVRVPATKASGLTKNSGADSFQVKSVSLSRFDRKLGSVTAGQVTDIAAAVANCVGAP